jgi:hypothetical protein
MTKYQVGVLWKGQNYSEAKVAERIQAATDNMKNSVVEGKLVGALRVENPVDLWGMFFFKTESPDEMKSIAENSVLVKDGLLNGEVVKVWGTRGLGTGISAALKENPDSEIAAETYYMAIYRKGENWSEKSDDPVTRETTQEGMQYMFDIYKTGALRYYAAVEDVTRKARGMAIISAASADEALALAQKGPMVEKKWLTVEVTPVRILSGVLP